MPEIGEPKFTDANISELKGDVARAKPDDDLGQQLRRQELRRLTQANDMRDKFYWLAAWLAIATVATSVGLVVAVLAGRSIDSTVAVGFIAGLAIETVGVLAIMAGYLFPKGTDKND